MSNNVVPSSQSLSLLLPSEQATQLVAATIGPALLPGCIIYLSGPLGAGKTAFCRALIRSLGYNGRVKSPTYTLVEPYNLSKIDLYHFDFYRFSSEEELRDAGFEELLDSSAVTLVEWPEMAATTLPAPHVRLRLELAETEDARRLHISVDGVQGLACLNALNSNRELDRWRLSDKTD
ncbi:MAG: tRNA (adenosine(37)-N6)-threonylcarbamoyltransferase complex ATPase subunit type 1 TsaE [Burkholderiaceae bacterium]